MTPRPLNLACLGLTLSCRAQPLSTSLLLTGGPAYDLDKPAIDPVRERPVRAYCGSKALPMLEAQIPVYPSIRHGDGQDDLEVRAALAALGGGDRAAQSP
jgi:hypothetical protein